ncbi:MAG: DUF4434 domain-containing protein [Victivallales bacterium]|nr:DUF4434 domain-containing protein [Victivallales bacterium]
MKFITGTFVDVLASDIPSNNWMASDWALQFDEFKRMGIDTVIIIRVGFKDSAGYNSPVMKPTYYEDPDLVEIILKEGERTGIKVYIGLWDTLKYWPLNDWQGEVGANLGLVHEIYERYNKFSSFYGWYMSHEGSLHVHPNEIWKPLCKEIRSIDAKRPIIVSPRYHGCKCDKSWPVPPDVHARHFDYLLGEMEGLISAFAFMDGHVAFSELPDYVKATAEVFKKHGIAYWSNLETFDRDMPWKFPPIEWSKLRYKLETVQDYVEKIISFELPHFLSPYSMFPSARKLHARYMDFKEKNS